MNIVMTLSIALCILFFILMIAVKELYREHKEKLAYKTEAERKSNTIDYLYKHAEELEKINQERRKEEQELKDAETDEEVLAVINNVVDSNNDRVRKQAKKRN